MPHATNDETMEDGGDGQAIAGFLREYGGDEFGFDGAAHQRAFDQTDKAADAEDYEDISDDDLPEEEEATQNVSGDEQDGDPFSRLQNALGGLPVQPPQPQTNGYHGDEDEREQHTSDLFGEGDDIQDLFGDHSSSPEQQRAVPANHANPPQQRPGGLALPTKSSLALPSLMTSHEDLYRRPVRQSSDSMSPASSFHGDVYSPATSYDSDGTDEAGMTKDELEQRKLFKQSKKRQAGENVDDQLETVDLDFFYSTFPRFETNQAPNFADLFPPRPATYRGKVPLKPPRAVQATKVSLDLLPDQEKSFKTPGQASKGIEDQTRRDGLVYLTTGAGESEDSDEDLAWSTVDENERIGGVTMNDLAIICGDWDVPSSVGDAASVAPDEPMEGEWEREELARPRKRRRISVLDKDFSLSIQDPQLPFEEPERATARLAKSIALDLNDPNLLIDELPTLSRRRSQRPNANRQRDSALNRDFAKRYNISNDKEYDKLKENHQHKVRSTLGSMAVEHSLPATKLQYPFYKINLDPKQKRAFHRPHLDTRDIRRELRFSRMKHIKRKHIRGREVKSLFAKAEDLHLGDNANVMLLEYSEEAPMMLSNFGMGNRLINYYRKRDTDDQERPKKDIGETHVLLTQDKSPFSNFGHVDKGEMVPTVQNGMYRAPVFAHQGKSTDFLVGLSSTYSGGNRFYLRNVENLHTVGQQFPIAEVPGQHSRKVTDAAKKRLRALSYRMYTKSQDPTRPRRKPLNNENLMPHLPGHDMPQTRSKMREFMKYERAPGKDSGGTWVPMPGQVVPDNETLRSWIRPEDVCLLDSMQVGVQHLGDLGIKDEKGGGDDDKELDDDANIELLLAPWRISKNFLNACQGKAMLKLHGEGDPTGCGEGFNFVKTSMKGGFKALGQSADDKIEAKKRQQAGGHMYNVAKQQKLYDDDIRGIWERQKQRLSEDVEMSDTEMEDAEEAQGVDAYQGIRGATPRSSMGTPATFARHEDDSVSQFSRTSTDRGTKPLVICRRGKDKWGVQNVTYEKVTNPRVAQLYKKRRIERNVQNISVHEMVPTGDEDMDALKRQKLEAELARVSRNLDRREAREKTKVRVSGANSPGPAAGSPAPSDANDTADGTPQKGGPGAGRGRNKDGTARKCANCGQVGHIKTNRKSVTFRCPFCLFQSVEKMGKTLPATATTAAAAAAAASPSGRKTKKKQQQQDGHAHDGDAESAERVGVRSALMDSYSKFVL